MQLNKRFLDLSPWHFPIDIPMGKDIADVEEIHFVLKKRPEYHVNNASIHKKRTEGAIAYTNGELIVQLEALDFNGMQVGYNYFGGIVFQFTGEPGFNEDAGNFDVVFDYPVYFTGEDMGDQIQDPDTLLDIYLQMIKVETFTAGAGGQSVFTVASAPIKDNVLLQVQVGAQLYNPTNGVKGYAGGLYTVDFDLGTITFTDPLDEGTQVIITYS